MVLLVAGSQQEEATSMQRGGMVDEWSERRSSYGNSLNAMDGWTTPSPCHARLGLGTSQGDDWLIGSSGSVEPFMKDNSRGKKWWGERVLTPSRGFKRQNQTLGKGYLGAEVFFIRLVNK